MGFCPPGFLSSLDFVCLDIVLWVIVQWDFVLIPWKPHVVYEEYGCRSPLEPNYLTSHPLSLIIISIVGDDDS